MEFENGESLAVFQIQGSVMPKRIVVREFQVTGFNGHRPYELTVPVNAEIRNVTVVPIESGSTGGIAVFECEGQPCACSFQVFTDCTAPVVSDPATVSFRNRSEAGRLLAAKLSHYRDQPGLLVLGLPRGGVPVAREVAHALDAPLDVLVVRKLGVPGFEELALGAIASGGVRVLNQLVVDSENLWPELIDTIAEREQRELERREHAYRKGRPALDVQGRTVILVDDGLATGSTMLAAVKSLRQRRAGRIIVAVPVAPPEACDQVAGEADEVVCLATPESFYAVGAYYEDFPQVSDEEVQQLLEASPTAEKVA